MRDICTNRTPLARTRPNRTGEPGFLISVRIFDPASDNLYNKLIYCLIQSFCSLPPPCLPLTISVLSLTRPRCPPQPRQLRLLIPNQVLLLPQPLLLLVVVPCLPAVSEVDITSFYSHQQLLMSFQNLISATHLICPHANTLLHQQVTT
jgi:hypothetical protein